MGSLTDAAIAASLLIDLIESLNSKGVVVTVEDLDKELKKREQERKELEQQLFPEGFGNESN
jgi:hypothetical protein